MRILARLEKKEPGPDLAGDMRDQAEDGRVGLNLTYRTLAATLKYDKCIPRRRCRRGLIKGYYRSEERLVRRVKANVVGSGGFDAPFKTIECQIMDIADDIAYSIYDLEDALKTEFVSPMSMISELNSPRTMEAVQSKTRLDEDRIIKHVMDIWATHVRDVGGLGETRSDDRALEAAAQVHKLFRHLTENGALRTGLTSELVNEYVEGIEVDVCESCPALSHVTLKEELRERVEVVKNLTYELVVNSPNLKTVEYRGSRIVRAIFDALSEPDGDLLLPDDYRAQLRGGVVERERAICDFIAGMTDRYALEFYGRLHSEGAQTIFKPL